MRAMIGDLADDNYKLVTALSARERELQAKRRDNERLLQTMRLWDQEIRALLGPYTSFAIDDTTFRVDRPDQIRRMQVIPQLRPDFLFAGPEAMESLQYYIETMLGFIAGLDEDTNLQLRRLLSVRVKIGGDRTGQDAYYAISESMWAALKNGPEEGRERLAMRLGYDFMRLLSGPPKPKAPEFENATRRK